MRSLRAAALLAATLLVAACSAGSAATTAPSAAPSAAPSSAPGSSAAPSSAAAASSSAAAGAPDLSKCPTSQPAAMATTESKLVTIDTSKGQIVIKVDGKLSPIAAGNFVALAECGYYTGVVFHRLVPGFVIQGGDGTYGREPNVDKNNVGTGGPGYTIQDEPVTGDYVRGVVAMAKTSQPNSANSQFFIVLADLTGTLSKDYQIFGSVTQGMNVVDAIAAMPNSGQPDNRALNPVAMDKVTVSNP
jgi:cyclophilin family peptidyl-prolyl cis-trans isomerase